MSVGGEGLGLAWTLFIAMIGCQSRGRQDEPLRSELPITMPELTSSQLKLIADAARYLERPSLLMELANVVGKPLEFFTRGLDRLTLGRVEEAVQLALRGALGVAIATVPENVAAAPPADPARTPDINEIGTRTGLWHKLSVAATGTAGGLFGLPGLAIELPLTTTIMLRSIAAIAQEFGEDLRDTEIRLQCLSAFSLGGPGRSDDAMESTYLTARLGVQSELTVAARAVAGLTTEQLTAMIQKGSAPAVVNLLARIAARFNLAVTEKLIAQAIPIIGAAAGATINVAFMGHFNRVARFHFALRSLERQYGAQVIQDTYRQEVAKTKRLGPESATGDGPDSAPSDSKP